MLEVKVILILDPESLRAATSLVGALTGRVNGTTLTLAAAPALEETVSPQRARRPAKDPIEPAKPARGPGRPRNVPLPLPAEAADLEDASDVPTDAGGDLEDDSDDAAGEGDDADADADYAGDDADDADDADEPTPVPARPAAKPAGKGKPAPAAPAAAAVASGEKVNEAELAKLKDALRAYSQKWGKQTALKVLQKFGRTSADVMRKDFKRIMESLKL